MKIRNKDSPIVYICSPYSGDVSGNLDMDVCRELWVCGDVISDGMRREMAYAADIGIPIRHVKEEEIYVCN